MLAAKAFAVVLVVCCFIGCVTNPADKQKKDLPTAFSSAMLAAPSVLMPTPIATKIHRIALIPMVAADELKIVPFDLEQALNFLRLRQPHLMVVERGLSPLLKELYLQHSGRVDDLTVASIGKLAGADSLLMYHSTIMSLAQSKEIARKGGHVVGGFELRLVNVETGSILFQRQVFTSASVAVPNAQRITVAENELVHLAVYSLAQAYAVDAFLAACGENPLGVVWDKSYSGSGARILGTLEVSPAHNAGLDTGDLIEFKNGEKVTSWTEQFILPISLTINRKGTQRDVTVQIATEH